MTVSRDRSDSIGAPESAFDFDPNPEVSPQPEAVPFWESLLMPMAGANPEVSPQPEAVPSLIAFDNRLKVATPYLPVTFLVVMLNLLVFALMVLKYDRVLHFNADILVNWGGDYGLKTFAGEWWRPLTSTFLHSGFGHLTGNLFFLLLIAPLVERLLGPARFVIVYLFAGIGAALFGLGAFPTQPSCGASGAIDGLYGAFLGCYLRGVRTIPARIFLRSVGLLVLFTLVQLLRDYLEVSTGLIVHLSGFLFGFAGGLLFGHVLHPRKMWDKLLVFSLVTSLCCILLFVTASLAREFSRETVTLLARYDAAFDQERELVARFHDALDKWKDGDLSNIDLQSLLEFKLIPDWERSRTQLKLPDDSGLENHPLSLRELKDVANRSKPRRSKDTQPLSDKEFDLMFRLYLKLRVDNWRALAKALKDDSPNVMMILLEDVVIAGLRHELNEIANEKNPLNQ
jgi:membrane associated rhomboid family serine protease